MKIFIVSGIIAIALFKIPIPQLLSFTKIESEGVEKSSSDLSYNIATDNSYRMSSDFIQSDTVVMGIINGSGFGQFLASAGDVNSDSFNDLLISDRRSCEVLLYFGGASVDNIPDVRFWEPDPNSPLGCGSFGSSISSGDVNGDGFSDILVGYTGGNGTFYNYVANFFVYLGGTEMDSLADIILIDPDSMSQGTCSIAGDLNADGFSDVVVSVDTKTYVYYGGTNMNSIPDVTFNIGFQKITTAGDVNDDGYDDILCSLPFFDNYRGKALIYFGGVSMNTIADVIFTGESIQSSFGSSISTAGDLNSDGYSDILIGAYQYNNYKGKTYIYLGGPVMDSVPEASILGEFQNDRFGASVSTSGDLNSDGYDDIIIGAPGFLNNRGRAYIHYGGSNISSVPDFIHTNQSPFRFGDAVSHAGDMDNNGMDDIAISATSLLSRVYVFLTKAGLDLISPTNNSTGLTRNVLFEWGKFNEASKYIFQVSSDSLISNLIVSDTLISDTSRYLQGLALETKYYWRVKAMDSSGNVFSSEIWNFTTIPPIRVSIKAIFEGLYYPLFNILARKDTINLELRNRIYPFDLVDSCIGVIDSLNFTGLFTFNNAPDGKYYLVIKHFQSIETWSKSGGDSLVANGSINHYDFTSSASQAYGNNLKLKGGKYCLISGDVYQDGFIDGSDLLIIDNDAYTFSTGRFLISDINGDGFADAQDMQLADNNKSREVIKP